MSEKQSESTSAVSIWTPSNIITLVRICLVPIFVAALLAPWPEWWNLPSVTNDVKCIVAAFLFIVISGTDWLDGYLARKRDEITDFGKFMDPLADKFLVTAALIALVELHTLPTWVVLIILAREFIVSGIRMMAASQGVVIAASYLGKFKTVFQMVAIVLFTVKDVWASISASNDIPNIMQFLSWAVMIIALILTAVSLIDYLYKARSIIGLVSSKKVNTKSAKPDKSACMQIDVVKNLVSLAQECNVTLSVAESLTGGMIGESLTSIPGASRVFMGGVVSYTNEVKNAVLHVPWNILDTLGAVSYECACAMAEGVRCALSSDYSVAVTGIAGPGNGESGKSQGTVWIGISSRTATNAQLFQFKGDRDAVRRQTTEKACELLISEISRTFCS